MDLTKEQINALISCCEKLGCSYSQQEPLEKHTTFRAGGPAELFVRVQNGATCAELLHLARQLEVPVHILGKGSNLLVSDQGVEDLVLHMESKQNEFQRKGNEIIAWAGENLSALCMYALEQNLSGLEFAYGIPGSVGGAVYMNAGAYGGEVKDCLKWVRYLDENLQEQLLPAEQLDLSYRHSMFCGTDCVILEACFELKEGNSEDIKAIMDDVMFKRRDKQPLEHPSGGSTFKRPEGAFAAALIDQCGLKGRRVGGACVSEKHAGFIVNDKQGSCQDILDLIEIVRAEVKEKTGYELETEVEFWGK